MHTSWSHDCTIDPEELLDHAEAIGLGAIAVTDHNVFGGALEAVELARDRDLIVIPGEEIKTDGQAEVIGLVLSEEIPRGMSFAATVAAIRAQDGVVYLPHPFDRLHSVPDPGAAPAPRGHRRVRGLQRAAPLRGVQRRGAPLRAQVRPDHGRRSDAHVLQGVGTGGVRMQRFDDPEEFLLSLRTAEVLRRPKSLAYLQSLKWMAQVKKGTARRRTDTLALPCPPRTPDDEIYERYLRRRSARSTSS